MIGARVPISTCFWVSERVLFASSSAGFLHFYIFVGVDQVRSEMFSICETVCMIWFWKLASMMARSLRAILIQRRFELNPNPCNKCCRKVNWKLALTDGFTVLKVEFVLVRLLL